MTKKLQIRKIPLHEFIQFVHFYIQFIQQFVATLSLRYVSQLQFYVSTIKEERVIIAWTVKWIDLLSVSQVGYYEILSARTFIIASSREILHQ